MLSTGTLSAGMASSTLPMTETSEKMPGRSKMSDPEQDGQDTSVGITDPLEYPHSLRWSMVVVLTTATVVTYFSLSLHAHDGSGRCVATWHASSADRGDVDRSLYSTAFEPALPYVMQTFNSDSSSLATFTVSIYVLGYIFGPVLVAPASEVYGRLPVLHAGAALFLICLLACSFSNSIGLFIFFRAMMGFAGITLVLLAPAVVADVIPKENRGLALSVTTIGPAIGPTLGPIMGGYIVEKLSWRWIFWIGTMLLAVTWAPAIVLLRETFPPVLKAKAELRAKRRLSQSNGTDNQQLDKKSASQATIVQAEIPIGVEEKVPPPALSLKTAWTRPLKMLFGSPILLIVALYTSLLNSYLQIYYATIGISSQEEYGFTTGQSGLAYLGLTVGLLVAQLVTGKFADRHLRWMERRHDGVKKPEYRLIIVCISVVTLPIGICLYGWSLQAHTHWIVPIVGTGIIGVGFLFGYLPCQFYIVDVYTLYAASAIGGCTLLRSIITAVLPLAADPIFSRLGYGWGNTLLAGIITLFVPFLAFLYKYGEKLRTNARFKG